jgi:hypothetical protein
MTFVVSTLPMAAAPPPSLFFYGPVSDNFSNKGNSALESFDSGQPRFIDGTPQIINGRLTHTPPGSGSCGSYSIANLGKRVTSIGGSWIFTKTAGGTGTTGSVAFPIWNWLGRPSQSVPDSGFHFVITRLGWSVSSYPSSAVYATASFTSPLANDGVTVLNFLATINAGAGTAQLNLPDGTQTTIGPFTQISSSPGIGNFPCWEPYQFDVTVDDLAGFITLSAS